MVAITTLFMLMSLDGKISTGAVDERDFDKDFRYLKDIKQYYSIKETTDLVSFIGAKTLVKLGGQ